MTMFKIVMTIQIQLIHKYVSVTLNYVMMNVMMIVNLGLDLGLDLMDSNVIIAIQKIHGAMILIKLLIMEMMPLLAVHQISVSSLVTFIFQS